MQRISDIVYRRCGEIPLKLEMYLPDAPAKPIPLIVWIIGGGWWQCQYARVDQTFLVDAGFAVASVQYRVSSQASAPAQIHDCKAAVRFLRAHSTKYNIDPQRLGVYGSSAGGCLALLVAMTQGVAELEDGGNHPEQSSAVRAAASFAGPTDMVALISGTNTADPQRLQRREQLLGGPFAQRRDVARQISPVTYAVAERAASLPPILLVHGMADNVVAVEQARLLSAALERIGANVKAELIPELAHGGHELPQVRAAVLDFFRRTL